MHDMTTTRLLVAGVFAATAVTAALIALAIVAISARRRRAPAYVVSPVPAIGRVCNAEALAAAWRASGFSAVQRRHRIDVQAADGTRAASLIVPGSRRFGDAAFTIESRNAVLVRHLLSVASAELGPLVCSIDGRVHGFHAEPSQPRCALGSEVGSAPRARGSVRDRAARSADDRALATAQTALHPLAIAHATAPRRLVTLRGVPAAPCA